MIVFIKEQTLRGGLILDQCLETIYLAPIKNNLYLF